MKTIESTVKRFPGSVVLPDYLNVIQVRAIEDSFLTADQIEKLEANKTYFVSTDIERKLPALLACVRKWSVTGVPEDPTIETFPSTPIKASSDLIDQIYKELLLLYRGEAEVPNE